MEKKEKSKPEWVVVDTDMMKEIEDRQWEETSNSFIATTVTIVLLVLGAFGIYLYNLIFYSTLQHKLYFTALVVGFFTFRWLLLQVLNNEDKNKKGKKRE